MSHPLVKMRGKLPFFVKTLLRKMKEMTKTTEPVCTISKVNNTFPILPVKE